MIALLQIFALKGSQSALNPAGPQSARIHFLTQLFTVTLSIVFLLILGFIAAAIYRALRNTNYRPAEIPNQRRAAIWVSVCIAATVAILTVFLFETVAKGRAMTTFPGKEALEIDVISHQWWWELQYANPSAGMRVVGANEIHIPVGRPVRIVTTSRDVIHSFWVPNLHGKTDSIPNHANQTWIQADRAGRFRGQCAEYCGLQHANMAFLVVAEPEAEFDRWVRQQREPSNQPITERQRQGQQIFLSASCILCHRVRGTAALGFAGPDLTHFGSRAYIAAGTVPNTPGYLAGWITDSQHLKPGNRMPPINLEPGAMQPLLDYLESLK